MSYYRAVVAVMLAFAFLAYSQALLAEQSVEKKLEVKQPSAGKFLRVIRDENKEPRYLETAVVRYVPAKGEGNLTVDLIGAVHIGDRGYYDRLNRLFEDYDVLLYELVAPEGTVIPKGGKRDTDNPIAVVQKIAKFVLDLELQTEQIDYTRKNFVHADMSPEQMKEAIRKRGDDGVTLFLSIAADLLRQQNLQELNKKEQPVKVEDVDWAALLVDPAGPAKMKRMMAQQFENLDGGAFGQTLNTILIADRNQAALKVFQKELAKGKKKIGIFYGAAHLPDFEKRLKEDFGLKRDKEVWLTAWDLRMRQRNIFDLLRVLDEVMNQGSR